MINRKEIAVIVLMVLLIAGIWTLVGRVGTSGDRAQTQFVRDAVRNAALTCYAVEGAYPDSLDYLREHYGLAYDQNRYRVTYDAFASNLVPGIFVTDMTEEGDGVP